MKPQHVVLLLTSVPFALTLTTLGISAKQNNSTLTALSAVTCVALVVISLYVVVGQLAVTHQLVDVPTQGKFVVPNVTDGIYDILRIGLPWEKAIQKLIVDNLEVGDNMIDVGAHIGSHTVPAAKKVGPTGHVYAFEPIPEYTSLLKMAIIANDIDNVTTFPYALGAASNVFVEMHKYHGRSKVVASNTGDIPLRTLDSYIDELPPIKLMKIDVEGFEYDMLLGASDLIRRDAPIIIIEIWPSNVARVKTLLGSMGPRGYTITHFRNPDDYLAVSK